MTLRRKTAALLLIAAAWPLAAAPVAPFSAIYEVRRNGSVLGEATLTLAPEGAAWRLSTATVGTAGLARAAGVRIDELTRFAYLPDGRPATRDYAYHQRSHLNERRRGARVGKSGIDLTNGKEHWTVPAVEGAVDRQLTTVALMQKLAAGRSGTQRLQVIGRGKVEAQTWAIGAQEAVPGSVERGRRIERVRETPDGRRTVLWLDDDNGHVPLRIEQREDDGETIEMRLLRRG